MAFADDISSQGQALRDLVKQLRTQARDIETAAISMLGHHPTGVVLTGMGTSEHVGWVVADSISQYIGLPVSVRDAGELLHYGLRSVHTTDVLIAISQSGESVETRKLIEQIRESGGTLTVSITDDLSSSVARLSEHPIAIHAGSESSISTKTYTNTIGALLSLQESLGAMRHEWLEAEMVSCSKLMDQQAQEAPDRYAEAAEDLGRATCVYFVSRGPALTAALQAALTFQEGCHVAASALSGGAFRHGPMELAGRPDVPVVVFASGDSGGELLVRLASQLAELGTSVILVSPLEAPMHPRIKSFVLPSAHPQLLPLQCAVIQERLLQETARLRGVTPGEFAVGGKVTLVE